MSGLPTLLGTPAISGTIAVTVGSVSVTLSANITQIAGHAIVENGNGRQAVSVEDSSGNAQPAGDVLARPVFVKLSDGTVALLPAAAALSDALANPTTSLIGANALAWDPVAMKWVRLQVVSTANPWLQDSLATLIYGENEADNRMMVEASWLTASITTQTTTLVKSGAGKMGGILIPTPVANATIKVYDSLTASGTVLVDTITFPAALLSSGPVYLPFMGKAFSTGLTVVTAGATMAVDVDYL